MIRYLLQKYEFFPLVNIFAIWFLFALSYSLIHSYLSKVIIFQVFIKKLVDLSLHHHEHELQLNPQLNTWKH